jgi:hypothetical protein
LELKQKPSLRERSISFVKEVKELIKKETLMVQELTNFSEINFFNSNLGNEREAALALKEAIKTEKPIRDLLQSEGGINLQRGLLGELTKFYIRSDYYQANIKQKENVIEKSPN